MKDSKENEQQEFNILSAEESKAIMIKADMVDIYEKVTGLRFFDLLVELCPQGLPSE